MGVSQFTVKRNDRLYIIKKRNSKIFFMGQGTFTPINSHPTKYLLLFLSCYTTKPILLLLIIVQKLHFNWVQNFKAKYIS